MKTYDEFGALVHRILVNDRKDRVADVAEKMGMSYENFYARLRGRVIFSPTEVRALLKHLRDPRLITWLLDGTPYLPAERVDPDPEMSLAESLRKTAMTMMFEANDAAEQLELALCDGRIDPREADLIRADIDTAERAMATLREHVNKAAK